MVDIPFAYGASDRTGFPRAIFQNCMVEKAETQVRNTLAILARPGMLDLATVGTGPIRGVFQRDGVFGGDALVLSGTTLYRVKSTGAATAFTGSVEGFDTVEIEAGQNADLIDICRIATGDALYVTDPVEPTIDAETFPDDAGVTSICFHRMYWFAVQQGTDKVYYKTGNNAWAGLDFVSAEYQPDKIQAIRSLGDVFALLGSATVEPWALDPTGTPAIAPVPGLAADVGCRNGFTAKRVGEALYWVTENGEVVRSTGGAPEVISTPSVTEQIGQVGAMDLRANGFNWKGHPLYVLGLSSAGTLVYDASTKVWANFTSKGRTFWTPRYFCAIGDRVIAADSIVAKLYRLDADALDDAGDEFTLEWMAFDEVEATTFVHNLVLDCLTGYAPRTGQGSSPILRMRFSDDDGKTWSNWANVSLGAAGTTPQVIWRRLGRMKGPGRRIWHFRCSEPIIRRVTSLKRNVDL